MAFFRILIMNKLKLKSLRPEGGSRVKKFDFFKFLLVVNSSQGRSCGTKIS